MCRHTFDDGDIFRSLMIGGTLDLLLSQVCTFMQLSTLHISPFSRSFKTFKHELELYYTTVKTQAVIRDACICAYLGCAHLFVNFLLSFSFYFLGKGVYLCDEVRQCGNYH